MYMQHILFDSGGEDKDRIIILGKNDLLKFLDIKPYWTANETFKVVLELFF